MVIGTQSHISVNQLDPNQLSPGGGTVDTLVPGTQKKKKKKKKAERRESPNPGQKKKRLTKNKKVLY